MAPLGQIGKRLQIIKIAISLTDKETINMQLSKLRLHKDDKQLNNILSVLDDENYVQASNLIDRYIHGPYGDETEAGQEEEYESAEPAESDKAEDGEAKVEDLFAQSQIRSKEEEELIKKFGLFMEEASKEEYNPIDEEEIFSMSQSEEKESVSPEEEELTLPRRQPSTEEILASYDMIDEEKIPQSDMMKPTPSREPVPQEEHNEKEDLSFSIDEIPPSASKKIHFDSSPDLLDETETIVEEKRAAQQQEQVNDENVFSEDPEEETDEEDIAEADNIEKAESAKETKKEIVEYPPISYIDQKFRNMRNQYPQIEESSEKFESEKKLLYMISLEGYTEADIEEVIAKVFELKNEGKLAEASHLLLITAATESLYAQHILARELYKGEILQKDLREASTPINRLALYD